VFGRIGCDLDHFVIGAFSRAFEAIEHGAISGVLDARHVLEHEPIGIRLEDETPKFLH
jgi:hypothetical protein